jgi:hypothetical protein
VIGVLLDRATATIRFFKNGQDLGIAFRNVTEARLFPTVGLRTQQEEVRANFGAGGSAGFAVDLPAMRAAFVRSALDAVRATKLPATRASTGGAAGGTAGDEGTSRGSGAQQEQQPPPTRWPLLPALVFEYLLHHRCWRTAEALAKDTLGAAAAAAAAETDGGGAGAGRGGADDDTTMQREGSLSSMDAAGPSASSGAPPQQQQQQQQQQRQLSGGAGGDGDTEMAPAPSDAGDASGSGAAAAAAAAATAAAAALSGAEVEDALCRQTIYDAVCSGRLDDALQQVERHYGAAALAAAPGLAFRLKVQQFLELVRARAPAAAVLEFGRAQLGPAAATPEDEELLADAVSLMAYGDPEASPCGNLLSVSRGWGGWGCCRAGRLVCMGQFFATPVPAHHTPPNKTPRPIHPTSPPRAPPWATASTAPSSPRAAAPRRRRSSASTGRRPSRWRS